MCGGFIGGWIANRFGRKGGLLINNVVGIVAALAMVFSKYITSYELLIIGRYLIGVNCGKILNLKKNKIQISNWLEPTEAFFLPKSVRSRRHLCLEGVGQLRIRLQLVSKYDSRYEFK